MARWCTSVASVAQPVKAMHHNLVSTIVPVHNRPDLLVEAVASVLAQTYRPIEVIIVDDGSTDATPEVARKLATEAPGIVRFITRANGGPGRARQTGLEAARGEFIQYLDSDDLLLPCKFELQVSALSGSLHCGVAYGKTRHYKIGTEPKNVPFKRTGERIGTLFPALLENRWWSTSTPLYPRCLLDQVGPWSDLRNEEDWEYECRIGARGVRLIYCDAFVSDTRWHDGDQLHRGGSTDPSKLRDRAIAHRLIYGHARSANISSESPEMRRFVRELFLLARHCGAAGLEDESSMLFQLAREGSGTERGNGLDFRLYQALSYVIGWTAAGRLAGGLDRLRHKSLRMARG